MGKAYFQGRFIDVPDDPNDSPHSDVPKVTPEAVLEWVCHKLNLDPMDAMLEILSGELTKPK